MKFGLTLLMLFVVLSIGAQSDEIVPCFEISERGDTVYTLVEKMPEFPGGEGAMFNYLTVEVDLIEASCGHGVPGRSIVSAIIDSQGKVRDVRLERGVDPTLDKMALHLIAEMPDWSPGERNGRLVLVKYIFPILFRLK